MASDSDFSSDSSSETGSDWTDRPLRADYGGESQARFEASMKTVSQIWHIGWGRSKAICTMPGKKMLSKFKVPTQNKTVIIKWIPPLNVASAASPRKIKAPRYFGAQH